MRLATSFRADEGKFQEAKNRQTEGDDQPIARARATLGV